MANTNKEVSEGTAAGNPHKNSQVEEKSKSASASNPSGTSTPEKEKEAESKSTSGKVVKKARKVLSDQAKTQAENREAEQGYNAWLGGLKIGDKVGAENLKGVAASYPITAETSNRFVFGGESGDLSFDKTTGQIHHALTMEKEEPVRYVFEPEDDLEQGPQRDLHDTGEQKDVGDLDPSADKRPPKKSVETPEKSSW